MRSADRGAFFSVRKPALKTVAVVVGTRRPRRMSPSDDPAALSKQEPLITDSNPVGECRRDEGLVGRVVLETVPGNSRGYVRSIG